MERRDSLEHQLYSLMGLLALREPFSKSDDELHQAGLRHSLTFGPLVELPENFGARLRSLMESYRSVGLRPSED